MPVGPFSPTPYKNFIMSLIVSFIGFYGLIFYKEMNSSIIKTPEAIEHLHIPQISQHFYKFGHFLEPQNILYLHIHCPSPIWPTRDFFSSSHLYYVTKSTNAFIDN